MNKPARPLALLMTAFYAGSALIMNFNSHLPDAKEFFICLNIWWAAAWINEGHK